MKRTPKMSSPADPPSFPARSAGIPGRALAALLVLTAVLVAAFVFAPRVLAGSRPGGGLFDQGSLAATLREAFDGYWRSGDRAFSPGLETLVDYWFRYHVAKAVIAVLLLAVLVALAVLLWKAFLKTDGVGSGRRAALASAGVLATMLAQVSLVLVMANIQGTVAPFSSLISMLPVGETDGELAGTLGEVRRQLADSPSAGDQTLPALDVMIRDFSRYHAAMAVIATIVAAVLLGMSVASWTTCARTGSSDRRTRRLMGSFGVFWTLLSPVVIVVAVANTTTAANPVPALSAFFDGR
ncbi:hypothetical protein [Rhodococcus sp. NPDC004095]